MAYLMARSPSLLGAYRRGSPIPVLPQQRMPAIAQPSRFRIGTAPVRTTRLSRRIGLGQDTYPLVFPPPATAPPDIAVSPAMSAQISSAVASIPETVAPPPTGYPPLPAQIKANYTTNAQLMTMDPLNFVSPQAAIAAGVDPQKAFTAWTKAVGSFSSQQAAVAAGIPAGVVTSLWPASRTIVDSFGKQPSLINQLGGWPKVFVYGAVGLGLLVLLGGGKGRR